MTLIQRPLSPPLPDPLLALTGTLQPDVTDIGERHDDYIADALLAALWRNNDVIIRGDPYGKNRS